MREVFTPNADILKNSYLNWNMDHADIPANFYTMAKGYSESALILLNEMLKDNTDRKADSCIFPILYLINHSIELYFKAILRLLGNKRKGHDLFTLIDALEIKLRENNKDDYFDEINEVFEYISTLTVVVFDKERFEIKMDFSRYPVDNQENEFFYIFNPTKANGENVVIDIEYFYEYCKRMANSLENLYQKIRADNQQ